MARATAGLTNRELADAYSTYGHLVWRRCVVIVRDEALADDALQNTFIKVLRYGERFRAADAPLRWLYRVSDRCCFDLLDRRRRRAEVPPPAREQAAPPGVDVAARDAILAFLHRLSDQERRIAVLTFVDGL